MKRVFVFLSIALWLHAGLQAQPYSGPRGFDSVHRNEISGFLSGGHNTVTGFFVGEAVHFIHHLNDRWSVGGGEQILFFKQLFSLDAKGIYRLPLGKSDLFFIAHALLNGYNLWNASEIILNASALWESKFVDIRLGLSYIHYWMKQSSYTEPPTLTVGFGVNLKPRTSPWNMGLFIRTYDTYYYENWNINWGLRFYVLLQETLRLFGEFNVRPAGNMSQLANRYETSAKIGVKHVW